MTGATRWLTGVALVLVLSCVLLACVGCQDLTPTESSLTSTTAGTSTTTTTAEVGDVAAGSDDTTAPGAGGGHDDAPGPTDSSEDSPFTPMSFVDRPIHYFFGEADNGDPKTMRVGDSFSITLRYTVADEVADYTMSIHEPSITRPTGDELTRDPATTFYTEIVEHFDAVAPGRSAVVILLRHEDGVAFRVWQIAVEVV